MKKLKPISAALPARPLLAGALNLAIQMVTRLDIPAKGRIAHHIRTGRLQAALTLCTRGHASLWQKAWKGQSQAFAEQFSTLVRVQQLLRGELGAIGQNMQGGKA